MKTETRRIKQEKYNLSPRRCLLCNTIIPYERKKGKFCNSSCSASFNNTKKGKRKSLIKESICLNCKTPFSFYPTVQKGKYCNNSCQQTYIFIQKTIPLFIQGKIYKRSTLRRCAKYLMEYKCTECNIKDEYNKKILVLQLDHIDGNTENNFPSNLRWLCPNCHTQTPTYGNTKRVAE